MNFVKHSNLEGQHAFLGASTYHWINYTEEKVADAYAKYRAAQRGTVLHSFAAQCIKLGQRLPKSQKTLNMYVNDAIGYKMTPEQILYYSPNCFGTADAISFRGDMLRIHDLKTGESPTHMEQLMIYAALFCLEYNYKPNEIQMELRIYQNDGIICHQPTIEDIFPIMDRIITFDKIINSIKQFVIAVLTIVLALAVGAILVRISGNDPAEAYTTLFRGALGSKARISEVLVKMIPLTLMALGMSIAYKAPLWNIGANG